MGKGREGSIDDVTDAFSGGAAVVHADDVAANAS
jgi:hypothetical protein